MSTTYGANGETLVRCPINPREILKLRSLQTHLFKVHKECTDFVRCPYNFSHVIKITEIEKHYDECRDRCLDQDNKVPLVTGYVGKPVYGGTDYFETHDTFNDVNNKTYENMISSKSQITNSLWMDQTMKRGRMERRGVN